MKQSHSHIVSQFDEVVGTLLEDMGFRRGVFSSSPNGSDANGHSWSFVRCNVVGELSIFQIKYLNQSYEFQIECNRFLIEEKPTSKDDFWGLGGSIPLVPPYSLTRMRLLIERRFLGLFLSKPFALKKKDAQNKEAIKTLMISIHDRLVGYRGIVDAWKRKNEMLSRSTKGLSWHDPHRSKPLPSHHRSNDPLPALLDRRCAVGALYARRSA